MTISLSDTGKRFNREWIFRHFSYQFNQGHSYAITGANGSGKSTLLQVLSGSMHFNEGKCDWASAGKPVAPEKVFQQVSICAPYLEVVEEMTVTEFLDFHQSFKPFLAGVTTASAIEIVGLKAAADKQIRYYSSGMKQRVKLAQCIFSDTSLVLLDEPCTNLDLTGIDLYNSLIEQYCINRLVVVCSNDKTEYGFCEEIINIMDYK
jgi:ABC-type multidrug transport system ATPase subunit